ncbi:pyridoxal phosphate-dependent aminotransferase [Chloroflexota bacterium]
MAIAKYIKGKLAHSSWIRVMSVEATALKEQHGAGNVFDLTLGNPIVEPPDAFAQELRHLAENPSPGMHRYMETAGYASTRAAVAEYLSRKLGLEFSTKHIIMTCGAAGGMNVALKAVLDVGDEVIIFSPYFGAYVDYIENHGGIARIVPSGNNFIPDLDALASAINEKTKAVVVNSPNNPTGVVYDNEFTLKLSRILDSKNRQYGQQIYLISDEVYSKIIYDGIVYPSPVPHYNNTIIVTSHSKDLAIPGERIGYAAVHPDCAAWQDVVEAIVHCNRVLGYVNAPALMQNIVRKLQDFSVSIPDYQKKRDILYSNLTEMGYSIIKPQGAFYMFPKSPLEDDVAFIRELLEWKVVTVPGTGFGTPGYFRISYCVDEHTIEGSLAGFEKAAIKHRLR